MNVPHRHTDRSTDKRRWLMRCWKRQVEHRHRHRHRQTDTARNTQSNHILHPIQKQTHRESHIHTHAECDRVQLSGPAPVMRMLLSCCSWSSWASVAGTSLTSHQFLQHIQTCFCGSSFLLQWGLSDDHSKASQLMPCLCMTGLCYGSVC